MGYKKENYKYFQDRGRCPYCKGQRFAEPGLKVCAVCREKRNARLKEMRDEWRSAGLCTRCGKPVEGERRTCESCLAKHNQLYGEQKRAADREKYHQRLDAGKCVRCGIAWAEPGHSFCRKCLDKHLLECKRYDQTMRRRMPDGRRGGKQDCASTVGSRRWKGSRAASAATSGSRTAAESAVY